MVPRAIQPGSLILSWTRTVSRQNLRRPKSAQPQWMRNQPHKARKRDDRARTGRFLCGGVGLSAQRDSSYPLPLNGAREVPRNIRTSEAGLISTGVFSYKATGVLPRPVHASSGCHAQASCHAFSDHPHPKKGVLSLHLGSETPFLGRKAGKPDVHRELHALRLSSPPGALKAWRTNSLPSSPGFTRSL